MSISQGGDYKNMCSLIWPDRRAVGDSFSLRGLYY